MKRELWNDIVLSIPLENEATLNFCVLINEYIYDEGEECEERSVSEHTVWRIRKEIDGEVKSVDCSEAQAQAIIGYVIGRQARIGGPYR